MKFTILAGVMVLTAILAGGNTAHSSPKPDTVKIKPFTQQVPTRTPVVPDTAKSERRIVRYSPVRELQADIDGIIAAPEFANANIGISVLSIETGEYFYRKNEAKNFIPASTQKIFTTSAALDYLGKDFRFITRWYMDGTLMPSGEFVGNIILRGAGDPSLGTYFYPDPLDILTEAAMKLDSLGVRSVRGNIIADDSYFDGNAYGAGWQIDDVTYPYSAQVNALSINDNTVELWALPGQSVGDPARIRIIPENSFVRVVNSVTTAGPGEPAIIIPYREQSENTIELRGKIPLEPKGAAEPQKISVTVNNPPLFFLHLFKQALEKYGIRIRGSLMNVDDWNEPLGYKNLQPFFEHASPPLAEIVAVINKFSHNLCAEMLLKTLGKESSGIGSSARGAEVVRKFATRHGVATESFSFVDGSGLSRLNLFSPQAECTLLAGIYRSQNKEDFILSLPIPAAQGTLRNRMLHTRAEKFVRAKSGSMNNVSGLAGYAITRDGEPLAFSILINGFTVPQTLAENIEDLVCMRLASFTRK
jgi:D-alanyl-D-alanine carboxypeptidase/D-alanyl-D-alanine-endopeptidase (penicillin-binding protein 4)